MLIGEGYDVWEVYICWNVFDVGFSQKIVEFERSNKVRLLSV